MRWIIEKPVFSAILFFSILLLGFYSIKNTPIELVPEEKLPQLSVTDSWYGASPEMILQKTALPIEEEIMSVKSVKKVKTTCQENQLRMDVEFCRGTNMEFAYLAVKERINRIRDKLPPQARWVNVAPYVPKEFKKKPFLSVGIFSKASLQTVRNIAEREFLPALKSVRGVEHVELWGGAEPEVKISIDPNKMKLYGINIYEVYSQLGNNFYTLPSISIHRTGGEVSLALSHSAAAPSEIEKIRLKNGKISLRDIGKVFLSNKEIREEKRYQGMPVVVLDVYKEKGESSLHLSKILKGKVEAVEGRLGGKVKTKILEDESKELRERLTRLIKLSVLILFVIFAILLIIMRDIKASLLVFSSVFFSVFAAFTLLYILKIPVNLLTLSGFALGFGMFVDNAVVVFENIFRLRERGMEKIEAAVEGSKGVILPVLASTLTTIIVFFSFAYFQGRLRIYYLPLAYTIALALISSVFVAFTLVPSLSSRIEFHGLKQRRLNKGKFYPFIFKYSLFVLIPVTLFFIFSYRTFIKEVSFGRFFSWYQRQRLDVWVSLPPGATFQDTKKTILQFEKLALSKPYQKDVGTRIRENSADMEIKFPPKIEFSAYPYILKQELIQLATNMAGIGVGVWGFDPEGYYYSPSAGSFLPYSIEIKGYDFWKLKRLAEALKRSLLLHRRIQDVEILTQSSFFWGGKRKYYSLEFNFDAIRKYGINPRRLIYLLNSLLRSRGLPSRIKIGGREMDVEIRPKMEEPELGSLLSMEFKSFKGVSFRLKDVLKLGEKYTKGGIERQNQEYVAYVRWDYLGSYKKGEKVKEAIFKNLALPPGFKKNLEAQRWMMTEKEKGQLKFAAIISLILIFLILSILYESIAQPFIVMLSIPLALIGVFLTFVVADFPFDSTAYIGVILLFGIVVNNAIILVDHTNSYLRKGYSIVEAAEMGARERIRPIAMTSLTTVLGMLPLVIFHRGGQADIWTTLALCTVGGLTASALLVPVIIPIFYELTYKSRSFFR